MTNHVGFTGTREQLPQPQILELATTLAMLRTGDDVFHHGDCVGADQAGAVLAMALGYRVVMHPPINPRLRAYTRCHEERLPLAYHERNRAIVDVSHVLVACPCDATERARSGTWSTIRYAVIQIVPTLLIGPDGLSIDAPTRQSIAQVSR